MNVCDLFKLSPAPQGTKPSSSEWKLDSVMKPFYAQSRRLLRDSDWEARGKLWIRFLLHDIDFGGDHRSPAKRSCRTWQRPEANPGIMRRERDSAVISVPSEIHSSAPLSSQLLALIITHMQPFLSMCLVARCRQSDFPGSSMKNIASSKKSLFLLDISVAMVSDIQFVLLPRVDLRSIWRLEYLQVACMLPNRTAHSRSFFQALPSYESSSIELATPRTSFFSWRNSYVQFSWRRYAKNLRDISAHTESNRGPKETENVRSRLGGCCASVLDRFYTSTLWRLRVSLTVGSTVRSLRWDIETAQQVTTVSFGKHGTFFHSSLKVHLAILMLEWCNNQSTGKY